MSLRIRPAMFAFTTLLAATTNPARAQDHDMSSMPRMENEPQTQQAPPPQSAPARDARHESDSGGSPRSGETEGADAPQMPDMDMPMRGILGSYAMSRDASGTSWQPDAATHSGIMLSLGEWQEMGHLMLTAVYDTQSGPRGDDKPFLEGMAMLDVRRDYYGGDLLHLRAMLSPDAFMGKSGYPLLFATGETANGTTPLVDRQHPHELVMELSASFTHYLSAADSLFFYAGYPGEPALGPPAFPHRASGMDIPSAPITHHWLDSTHIVFGVATLGWVHGDWKVELSQFTGREPDENRFDFDSARFDSTSARVTWNPTQNSSFQISAANIVSPEQLEPDVDETRVTASAGYVLPLSDESSIAATLAWGLKHERPPEGSGPDLNGVLFETEYKPADLWTLFARAEWEQNAELESPLPLREGVRGRGIDEVKTLSLGAIRDVRIAEHWKIGLGALYAFDVTPHALDSAYGSDPHGTMVFLRLIAE